MSCGAIKTSLPSGQGFKTAPSTAKTTPAFGQVLTPCEGPPSAADSCSHQESPALGLYAYTPQSPPSRDHRALTATHTCTELFNIQAGTEVPFRIYCPCSAIHQTAKNNQIGYGDCLLSWAFEAHLAGEELEGLFVVSFHSPVPTASMGMLRETRYKQWDAVCLN